MNRSLRRVFANAGWFLGSRAVTGALSLFYLALAARSLGLAGFGQFALVSGLAQAVGGFVTFQTWQIIIRYGMPHLHTGDDERLGAVIGFSALLDAASAIAGTALSIGAILLLAPLWGWTPALCREAGLFCAATLLALRSTPIGMLRLHDRFALGALGDTVTPVARLAGAGIAALWAPTISGFLLAWGVAELATAAAFWALALRQQSLVWDKAAIRAVPRVHPGIWRFIWSTNASSTLGLSTRQLVLLFVGGAGGAVAAGAFRIASQIAQAIAKLTLAFSRSIFPELVRASRAGSESEFRRMTKKMTLFGLVAGAVGILFVLLFGSALLAFIAGRDARVAYWPMVTLTAAAALDLAGVTLEPALSARGRAGLALLLRLGATILQFLLLALLMPAFGMIGASIAVLAGSAAALAFNLPAVARELRRGPAPPLIAAEATRPG